MRVMKIGGNDLSDPTFVKQLATTIAAMDEQVALVHGGGAAIADLQTKLGLERAKVDGLRVTSSEALTVVEMVLSGQINKLLVRALLEAGVNAVGLSGVDGRLIQATKKLHPNADLGFVGHVTGVDVAPVSTLLEAGFTPVISPVSVGADHHSYNVNADEAATAIAAGLQSEWLDFISNVPGVLQDGAVLATLSVEETEQLIESGTIYGGMIPKVRSALRAVEKGVKNARIVNLNGLGVGGGTTFQNGE